LNADRPAKPSTIERPVYESVVEYWIRITDNVLPKIDGRNESMKSQLPQQPSGTRGKNERNELKAVLPELAPTIGFLLFSLQPMLLP
jgi:hypothetical protein